MLEAHALGNLVGGLLVDKLSKKFIGIREGCCRSLGCRYVAIDSHQVASIGGTNSVESLFEAGIAGGLLAVEYTNLSEYDSRCSTDGGHLLACLELCLHSLTDTLVLKQVAGTRHATWQHQQVGIGIVCLIELEIGLDAHTMSRFYEWKLCGADCYYLYTATTQYIDGNQGLDILETVC